MPNGFAYRPLAISAHESEQPSQVGVGKPSGLQLALDGANTHGRDCRDGDKQCRDHGEQDDARTTGERQLGEGPHVLHLD